MSELSLANAQAVYGLTGEMKASGGLEPIAIAKVRVTPATASCAVDKLHALRNLQETGGEIEIA